MPKEFKFAIPFKVTLGATLLILAACNYNNPKGGMNAGPQIDKQTALSYANVNSLVFSTSCTTCHGASGGNKGGVNLETYANVKSNLSDIQSDVATNQMPKPPRAPLSDSQKAFLNQWIAAGAPENPGDAKTPAPTPPPTPAPAPVPTPTPGAVPTFAQINAEIFSTQCGKCHSAAGGNRGGINLETYANVKANLTDVQEEVTGNSMPPKGPLSDADKALLASWITAGAPENSAVVAPAQVRSLSEVMQTMGSEFKVISAQIDDSGKNEDTLKHLSVFQGSVGEASNLTPSKLDSGTEAEKEAGVLEYKKMISQLNQLSLDMKAKLEQNDNSGAQAIQKQILDLKVQGHKLFKG